MKILLALTLLTSYGFKAERTECLILAENGRAEIRHAWTIYDISAHSAVGDDIQDFWLLEGACMVIKEKIDNNR